MQFVTYAQNFEDLMLYRALKDQKSGFYIDVGAAEPDSHSVTRAFYERGWNGINVEPTPWFFARLQTARQRDVNLQVAVSDSSGAATFYSVGENTGLSTLERPMADWHRSQGRAVSEAETRTTTLAQICEDHVGGRIIHFLKLDVEGSEFLALCGHDFSRWRPWIIVGEAHDAERTNEGWKAWSDLLIAHEYRFAYDDGLNRFYIAAEHHDRLAGAFEVPPNVYDDWILAEHFQLLQRQPTAVELQEDVAAGGVAEHDTAEGGNADHPGAAAAAARSFSMRPLARLLSDLHHEHTHRAGLISFETIAALERMCSERTINWSMETGCGLTTVALSNLSKRHVVFADDDRAHDNSSVAFVMNSPAYRSEVCSHVFGRTQLTIPAYKFEQGIDLALIDGPHGFPFPQLEYYYIYPHLQPNALLVIDDINIPHIWSMFACLAEDDMFELVDIIDGKTGFLRRTVAPAVSPTGDDWYLQRHNFMRWPMKVVPDTVWQMGDAIDFTSRGNRSVFTLLGWSQAEEWGAWSDGSEATISFRWPHILKPPVFVDVEFFYAARADIVLLLNGRVSAVLPGFPEHDMRWHTVPLQIIEEDAARTNVLMFKPTATWEIDAFPNKRQLGIALNHIKYTSGCRAV